MGEASQLGAGVFARLAPSWRQFADERAREAIQFPATFHRPNHHRWQIVSKRRGRQQRWAWVAQEILSSDIRPRSDGEPCGELSTLWTVVIPDLVPYRQRLDRKRRRDRLLGCLSEVFSVHLDDHRGELLRGLPAE